MSRQSATVRPCASASSRRRMPSAEVLPVCHVRKELPPWLANTAMSASWKPAPRTAYGSPLRSSAQPSPVRTISTFDTARLSLSGPSPGRSGSPSQPLHRAAASQAVMAIDVRTGRLRREGARGFAHDQRGLEEFLHLEIVPAVNLLQDPAPGHLP